jgi:hypothetical protein
MTESLSQSEFASARCYDVLHVYVLFDASVDQTVDQTDTCTISAFSALSSPSSENDRPCLPPWVAQRHRGFRISEIEIVPPNTSVSRKHATTAILLNHRPRPDQ